MDSVNRTVRMVVLAVPGPLAGTAHAAGGGDDAPSKRVVTRAEPHSAAQGAAVDFSLIDKLPPRYAASDCSAIVRKLKSFNVDKSEYETTSAYGVRIAALAGREIDGAGSDLASTYVADAGHLT